MLNIDGLDLEDDVFIVEGPLSPSGEHSFSDQRLYGSYANAKENWVVQHWSNGNDQKWESSPGTNFMGNFLVLLNLKLFEVGPQDDMQKFTSDPCAVPT